MPRTKSHNEWAPWIEMAYNMVGDPMSDRRQLRRMILEAREDAIIGALLTAQIQDWQVHHPGAKPKPEDMTSIVGQVHDVVYGRDWFPKGRHEK